MEEITLPHSEIWELNALHYKTGEAISISVDRQKITAIQSYHTQDKPERLLAPGFVDLQVNGYKGYDFNKPRMVSEDWHSVIAEFYKVGVTTFFPTLITNSENNLRQLFHDHSKILEGNKSIGGFHLEGPYISPMDGPRGAHKSDEVRKPDWDEFCRLQEAARGLIRLVTLSPEYEETPGFIEKAVRAGVKIAIGHTSARSDQIKAAVEAGATLCTHLGNGSHTMLPRHPNYIWDQLAEDCLWATVIADGHHLPDNVLRVFNKVKRDKMILVSDSVALAGLPPGNYQAEVGGAVTLTQAGLLHLQGKEHTLAGSAQNILEGIRHIVNIGICSLAEAIDKASILPAMVMGLDNYKGLEVGAPADFLLLNCSGSEITVEKTFKNGIEVL